MGNIANVTVAGGGKEGEKRQSDSYNMGNIANVTVAGGGKEGEKRQSDSYNREI